MPRSKASVEHVEIKDIKVGDKLLADIVGYKEKTIYYKGHVFSVHDIRWLRKKLAEKMPKLAPQKYLVGRKTPGDIRDDNGVLLVRRGQVATNAALEPLLKQGFIAQETFDGGKLYFKPTEWNKDVAWHITQYNPLVVVETTSIVDDDDRPVQPSVPVTAATTVATPATVSASGPTLQPPPMTRPNDGRRDNRR